MTAKMAFTKLLTFAVIGTLPLFVAAKSPVFAATPIGYFDGLHNDNCYIDGWTLDPDEPNTSIPVHVYRDGPAGSGTLVAAFTADVPRSDVNDVTGYPGNHAFAVNLDSSTGLRDGQPHQIYVYGINTDGSHTNTNLGNSPKTANCSAVAQPAQPAGSISANPNPCTIPSGGTTCTSSIVATVANADTADICVSPAGGSDQLFAGIGAGSYTKDAPWISNASYTFKLRVPSGNCSGAVIAAVNVTGVPAGVGGPPGGGQDQNQGQNQGQNQSQNNQQTTNVNVSNTNTNTNTINLTAAAKEKEKAKAKAPAKQPETGLTMGATLAMLSGAPLGLWLRRFGKGAVIVDTDEESMSGIGMSLVAKRASKLG